MSTALIIVIGIIILLGSFLLISVISFKKKLKNYDAKEDSKNLLLLNDNTFYNRIKGKIALVDFWAEWCQPCKIQGQIVSDISDDYANNDKIKICKLDIETNKKVASKLGIRNIPTMILFKNGKEVERFVGIKTKKVLNKALVKHID
ncbi:MAG: thioredoxin [Bacteroidota bacterium]|nr:thioredoxin [Bacteroidota bacterium]